MKYDFDTRVNRDKTGNIKKAWFTPESVYRAGVVSYAGAEFEFRTAQPVIDAVVKAAQNGLFGFTYADEYYLDHVVWWAKNVRHTDIEPEWVVPVQGTIFTVATCIRLFTKENEAIIVPTPSYNRYKQAADRLGRKTYFSPMKEENGVPVIDLSDLEAKMAEADAKLLILCNPNNPTGQIIPAATLEKILDLSKKYGVAVLQDEIFADTVLVPDTDVTMLAAAAPGDTETVSIISMGKTFSFTGVNNALAIIKNPELRERYIAQRNADHFGSIDPLAYAALCGGFTPEGKEWLEEMKEVIRGNNRKFREFFAEEIPGSVMLDPQGTYEIWVDLTCMGMTGEELQKFLIEEACFCCDPGDEYYGKDTQIRICTAVPPKDVDRSLEIFRKALRRRNGKA